jgi:hypothetical protein
MPVKCGPGDLMTPGFCLAADELNAAAMMPEENQQILTWLAPG